MPHRILVRLAGFLLVVGPLSGLGSARRSQVPQATADTAGLSQLRQAFIVAYTGGDAAAMRRIYAEDAVRMSYDVPAQVGLGQILAAYAGTFARRTFQPAISLRSVEVRILDTLAIERGSYHEVLRPKGEGPVLLEEGKYVSLARREAAGQWRYVWTIFNRDAPAHPLP